MKWGPPCIQQPAQVGIGSEDCLIPDVWKPADAKEGDKLPVIVYIHTSQGFPLYDWVNQSKTKIVGVTIVFRLNLLGFLADDAVQQDGDLNVGLLDHKRAALEWVQRHITKFGGDPDQVTIDGQSAGGGSVIVQMVAFGGSKPTPFKRAIGQSMGHNSTPTAEEAEVAFKVVGCPASGPESMPCLRRASVGVIVATINAGPGIPPGLVIDGSSGILPNLPKGTLLPPPDELVTEEDVLRNVFGDWPHLTSEIIQQALALYPALGTPGSPYGTQYDRAGTIDMMVECLDWLLANKSREKGAKNVFTYRVNSPNPVLLAEFPFQGVMHTSDLFYLFDGEHYSYSFIDFPELAERIYTRNNVRMTLVSANRRYQTHLHPISSAPNAGFTSTPFNSTEDALSKDLMSASIMDVAPPDEVERCKFWMSENVIRQTRL
ncbi:hypothetical protein ACEPAI_2073 [Sanghuangporus weigelae]